VVLYFSGLFPSDGVRKGKKGVIVNFLFILTILINYNSEYQ